MSTKRKIDAEGRKCNERWESEYMFVLQGEKRVCLEAVSVMKDTIHVGILTPNTELNFASKKNIKLSKN